MDYSNKYGIPVQLCNAPALYSCVELLTEMGIKFACANREENKWTIRGEPGIIVTYFDGTISIYFKDEADPFWEYKQPDDKVMLRGAVEVVRKLRRMGYQQIWEN